MGLISSCPMEGRRTWHPDRATSHELFFVKVSPSLATQRRNYIFNRQSRVPRRRVAPTTRWWYVDETRRHGGTSFLSLSSKPFMILARLSRSLRTLPKPGRVEAIIPATEGALHPNPSSGHLLDQDLMAGCQDRRDHDWSSLTPTRV